MWFMGTVMSLNTYFKILRGPDKLGRFSAISARETSSDNFSDFMFAFMHIYDGEQILSF